jgi:colanic acid biosynthesis glycosyl transferase WcaI
LSKSIVIYGINYAPEFAGVGRYTGEIGEHLAAEGHDVSVVTAPPHYPGWRGQAGYSKYGWSREVLKGASVYRCPLYLNEDMRGFRRLLAPLSFALTSAPVAFFQILKRRPDVVMAVEPTLFVAPLALLAAKLVGAKTVLHVQDLEVDAAFAVGHLGKGGLLATAANLFERTVVRGFDRVITISNRMAEKIAAKGAPEDCIEVVRNWVDLNQIQPMAASADYRRRLGLKPRDFVVLYSGNIGAKQGVRLLAEAAERLKANKDIVFVVAGDGPMRPELEAASRHLANLRVHDFQPESQFSEFLSIADLHILPQERDAADLLLPSKLGGMLASGRRIVVTAEPGTELATFLGGSCDLTPPGDAHALAAAVLRIKTEDLCHERQADRLRKAGSLSKTSGIAAFARAALFLQDSTAAVDAAPARVAA